MKRRLLAKEDKLLQKKKKKLLAKRNIYALKLVTLVNQINDANMLAPFHL
jgi:hypothetical protein